MEFEKKETIKILEKALVLLDALMASSSPLGVNDLARQCSMNLSTAFRILQTLKKGGWVFQDQNSKYIASPKISFVTEKDNFYLALKEVAYFTMSRLTNQESQAMNLIIRKYENCIILQQSRTEKIIDYVPPIGSVLPIYASAGGKILLSELPDLIFDEILNKIDFKPITKYTITNKTDFLNEIAKVRKNGYALDIHESTENGCCISVPVRNLNNEIIAALSFSGFLGVKSERELIYYYPILKKASEEITTNLYKSYWSGTNASEKSEILHKNNK